MTACTAAKLLTTLLLALAPAAAPAGLSDETYEQVRDHVLPDPEELGYRAIPWRASFWDAVVEAQEVDKPILLWAMNGHPLGCT